jgi:hypothetical protein
MATRSIVTSHPDIACDVCGRRLLRGEQPDVFLGGGQRRTVCELCVPRAANEGWLREAEDPALSLRPPRPRSARSLLGRLRQRRDSAEAVDGTPARDESAPFVAADSDDGLYSGDELYDFLDGPSARAEAVAAVAHSDRAAPTSGDAKVQRALAVFNASEHPRRVAGVARSLGAPSVRVAPPADAGSLVRLLVAWDLCWYRYEVDLGDEAAGVSLAAQGMELEELPAEDRVANAAADERGELSLLA